MMNGEGPLSGSSEWRGFLKSSDVGEEENKSWFPPPAKKARRKSFSLVFNKGVLCVCVEKEGGER